MLDYFDTLPLCDQPMLIYLDATRVVVKAHSMVFHCIATEAQGCFQAKNGPWTRLQAYWKPSPREAEFAAATGGIKSDKSSQCLMWIIEDHDPDKAMKDSMIWSLAVDCCSGPVPESAQRWTGSESPIGGDPGREMTVHSMELRSDV